MIQVPVFGILYTWVEALKFDRVISTIRVSPQGPIEVNLIQTYLHSLEVMRHLDCPTNLRELETLLYYFRQNTEP